MRNSYAVFLGTSNRSGQTIGAPTRDVTNYVRSTCSTNKIALHKASNSRTVSIERSNSMDGFKVVIKHVVSCDHALITN